MRISLIIIVSALFTSCASLNSNFDCPQKAGIHCESLDAVNARIDRGEISAADPTCHVNLPSEPLGSFASLHLGGLRQGEIIQRLWIAPFADKQGNLHNSSEIFVITKEGEWASQPVKEIHV